MRSAFRDLTASIVIKHLPGLIYHLADREARSNLKVSVKDSFIDIVEVKGDRGIRISRTAAAYTLDMINSFEYYFNSAQPIIVKEKSRMRRLVDFSTPRYQKLTGFDDFPILCPSLTEPYISTQQYVDFARLQQGDIVLDLGGYSGLTSIAFSKEVGGSGRVITLEPDPANFAAAKTNLETHSKVNGLDNVDLLQLAAAGERGVMRLSAEGAMGSAEVTVVGSHRSEVIEVETITLQDLVDRLGLPKVDFVKIDIEGSEVNVLAGAKEFLQRYWPRMIIEPHMVDGRLTEAPMKQMLGELGYVCETIPQHGVTLPLVTAVPPERGIRSKADATKPETVSP